MTTKRTLLAVLGAAVLWHSSGAATDTPPQQPPAAALAPVHADGVEFERLTLEAVRACLREDGPAAIEAMDRIEASCRILTESSPGVSHGILIYDQALHISLAKSRELAEKDQMLKAFDQFVWVTRQCLKCHEVARTEGRMKAPSTKDEPPPPHP